MKFPIYRVEFDIYVASETLGGWEDIKSCRQDVMLLEEFKDHDAARVSLERMVFNLASMLGIESDVTAWDGFMAIDRFDTWCYHYDSHYTYRRFADPIAALNSFEGYRRRHPDEVKTDKEEWHVCECETCKSLNRTMILHVEKEKCPTCSCVS